MKRFLLITAIVLIALIIIVSFLAYGYLQGWHITKHKPEELASLLKPYFQIKTPEGKGPFPTIIGFHAAGGIRKGNDDWVDYLVGLGYATILVDSFASRGFAQDRIQRGIYKISAPERAGDALVALDEARKLPFVEVRR
jgi:hypothetical protein